MRRLRRVLGLTVAILGCGDGSAGTSEAGASTSGTAGESGSITATETGTSVSATATSSASSTATTTDSATADTSGTDTSGTDTSGIETRGADTSDASTTATDSSSSGTGGDSAYPQCSSQNPCAQGICWTDGGKPPMSACGDPCIVPRDCPEPADGTATAVCVEDTLDPDMMFCILNCAGLDCPIGMECVPLGNSSYCFWPP